MINNSNNINILAFLFLHFFTSLCYFEKQIPHFVITQYSVFGMSLIQIGTDLALVLHAEVNIMNFKKQKHRYSDLNKIYYIIPEKYHIA